MKKQVSLHCLKAISIFLLVAFIGLVSGCGGGNGSSGSTSSSSAAKATEKQEKQEKKEKKSEAKVKTYKAGQYKVGADLPAGEYVVVSKGEGYVEVASDSSGKFESILVNDMFANRSIITVSDGEYLKVQNGTIYAMADAPKVEPKEGMLPQGMYLVGKDLPGGEYKVIAKRDGSYVEVSASSRHTLGDIISNNLFSGEQYITVQDGQYLKLFGAELKVK